MKGFFNTVLDIVLYLLMVILIVIVVVLTLRNILPNNNSLGVVNAYDYSNIDNEDIYYSSLNDFLSSVEFTGGQSVAFYNHTEDWVNFETYLLPSSTVMADWQGGLTSPYYYLKVEYIGSGVEPDFVVAEPTVMPSIQLYNIFLTASGQPTDNYYTNATFDSTNNYVPNKLSDIFLDISYLFDGDYIFYKYFFDINFQFNFAAGSRSSINAVLTDYKVDIIISDSPLYKFLPIWLNEHYNDGYNDGLAIGDFDSAYNSGYNVGYQNGYTIGLNSPNNDSYNNGYIDGSLDGELIGYNDGLLAGFDDGYTDGYNDGASEVGGVSWFASFLVGLNSILSIQFLPNFTLGTFLFIPLIFGLFFWFIKMITGGNN